ncbi:MAG: hypothetical protein AB1454_06830 [Candidatus Auribacterota bacterium]
MNNPSSEYIPYNEFYSESTSHSLSSQNRFVDEKFQYEDFDGSTSCTLPPELLFYLELSHPVIDKVVYPYFPKYDRNKLEIQLQRQENTTSNI